MAGLSVAAFLAPGMAAANPDGAPWISADPDTVHSCASCHFDHEPVGRSQALVMSGLPEYASPGHVYEVVLRFATPSEGTAGFLLTATSGVFESSDTSLESNGAAIRSLTPAAADVATWRFQWRAGDEDDIVEFRAAANAANDDNSAFGDEIHFRKLVIPVARSE